MNHSRQSRVNNTHGPFYSNIDNELEMLASTHNNHNAGRSAWNNQSIKTTVFTSTGNVTLDNTYSVLILNKSVAAITTVTLPASPFTGRIIYIKDGKGDAATNAITVQAASGNIDGSASQTISLNYGSFELIYNGTQWNIVASNRPITFPISIVNGGTNSAAALSNNRLMISSSGTIVEHAAQTNSRVLIADSNGLPVSTGNGTINGALTMVGNVSFTTTSTQGIVGTTTNDAAATGNVGQYTENVAGNTNLPTSTQYGDLTSISLTAGDWNLTALMHVNNNANFTVVVAGISTTTGNATTGLVDGSSRLYGIPSATVNSHISIAGYRMSLSATTTVYFKMSGTYTGTTPQVAGRLSARRVR